MNHEQAERLLSVRLDGERLAPRASASLERHLETCAECRAFERGAYRLRESARIGLAPAVPDLVEPIMAAVRSEPRPAARVRELRPARSRRLMPRLAPVAAALLIGAIAGSLVVGGPWQREGRSALAASDVTEGIAAAAVHLDAYQATFAISELHLSPEVPVRDLTMSVWFSEPERFRLDVVDHTDYPSPATPTDLRLVVDGSTSYASGPAPCGTARCPQRESVVRNRLPFSTTAAPLPADLILPVSTLTDPDRVTVLGRGTVLGRPAVGVEVPFERARPLFPFLEIGGSWRPFFPNDRVRIWLDERSWFPLRWEVFPATGAERDEWALRFGLPEEPALRPVFSVTALDVGMRDPDPQVFQIPAVAGAKDQGAVPVRLGQVERVAGFEPVAPPSVAGLDLYRVVLPREEAGPVVAYADGLAFLTLGETRTWSSDAPYGPVGVQAEEIALSGGGVAYYEPSSEEHARRLSIHAAGTDLYLESNLSRDELLAAAASLPVEGLPMPDAWRVRGSGGARVERVTLDEARAAADFPIPLPRSLPQGFGLASVELVDAGNDVGVTLYLRDRDADAGIGTIRLHLEPANALPPASSANQSAVDVAGEPGRFTPDRSQLEWIDTPGIYRSLDAPGLSLEDLLAVARSIPSGASAA